MKKGCRRKIFVLCMILVFVLSGISTYAAEQIDSPMKGPKYDFKTEYGAKFRQTFTGLPGNQPEEGTRVLSDDGKEKTAYLYFSDNGGPTVSISVAVGGKYGNISVSTNLGKKAASGTSVPITTGYFYKVKLHKTVEFQPYITYRKAKGTTKWEVYTKGAVAQKVVDTTYEPYKVK